MVRTIDEGYVSEPPSRRATTIPPLPARSARLGVAAGVAGCLAIAALTLALPSTPFYDAWAWLVWGREVLGGELHTAGGPSWKPLPMLFTIPFALFGEAAPELWLVVARAAGLGAVVAAAELGFRLAGGLGALLAGVLLLFSSWLWGTVWLGGSEGIMIMCVLGAVSRQLIGRPGQAFGLGVIAALVRPEVWPFLGVYAIWLLIDDRTRLRWIVPGLALIPVLWFLPELWGSGSLGRGAERAQMLNPHSPGLARFPALTVVENMLRLTDAAAVLGLITGLVAAALRLVPENRVRAALWVATLGVAWLALVAAMTEFGFSGSNRYLFVPLAVEHALGGVGLAWAIGALLETAARGRWRVYAAGAVGALAAVALIRTFALSGPATVRDVNWHAAVHHELDDALARAGGERRLERCGPISASNLLTPVVAWTFERRLSGIPPVPRFPGSMLRAKVVDHQPPDPPPVVWADAPRPRVVARTRHWTVEAACVDTVADR